MRTIAQGTPLVAGNQLLVFFHAIQGGHLTDPYALSFQIFRTRDDNEELVPVSVFPRTVVDLDLHRISTGRYSAVGWTPVTGAGGKGKHFVRWFWTTELGDAERSVDVPFDVQGFSIDPSVSMYASLSDVRSSGLAACDASDAKVVAAIRRASTFIEHVCGRFFEPRYVNTYFDGRGSSAMLFTDPIIALDELRVTTRPIHPSDTPIDTDFIRVFNRHLWGSFQPDDRNNSRIELFSAMEDWVGVRPFSFSRMVFPRAQQNVGVSGVFGYTDPDGSPFGKTPDDIQAATILLIPRYIPGLQQDAMFNARVLTESTRDQSYTLMKGSDLGLPTNLTGDPLIDMMLSRFLRPMALGGA